MRDGHRQALIASYGLVPKRKVQPGSKHYATLNARVETVGEKPTYRRALQQGHLCLVPMSGFFEPCYESGKAERWRHLASVAGSAGASPCSRSTPTRTRCCEGCTSLGTRSAVW
ncbi:SOS response-associated peptidase family protein [Aeromonas sobria]|uniref:SOS response-associated peptidase family protein n=1 Tax=Aeromonas sobria TaxID=646 RepID=UPI003B96800F